MSICKRDDERMRKWLILAGIVVLTVMIDQVAKWWVMANMLLYESREVLPIVHPYIQFTRTTNTGIAFGLGAGGSTFFLSLSVLIVAGLLWFYRTTPDETTAHYVALSLVIGGALGNIIDRARFGHVVDFFHVTVPGLISNVSNFADHFIVLGVIVLLVDGFINPQHATEDDDTADTASSSSPLD